MRYIIICTCLAGIAHLNIGLYAFALASTSSYVPRSIISRKTNGKYKKFVFNDDDGSSQGIEAKQADSQSVMSKDVLSRIQSVLRSTFLPTTSTATTNHLSKLRQSGYLSYILYDNLQDLTTSLRSVLATQRILEGVGVGRSDATALSATLNFLLRDGCGMIASLLFTSLAASTFRRNIKRWKYFADIMVDIGITLEIVAPSVLATRFRCYFLPLLCLGNVCKALCGVAAGATGGAFQMFWAVELTGSEEGISEVSAKNGAQRTVMGGLGLILAGLTAHWLDAADDASENSRMHKKELWIGMYCLLTFLHLTFNWMSLKLVALDWLNGWRLHHVIDGFLTSLDKASFWTLSDEDKASRDLRGCVTCSNPREASSAEPIFFFPELQSKKMHLCKYPIRLGVSFNELIDKSKDSTLFLPSLLVDTLETHNANYILKVGHFGKQKSEKSRCILVCYTSKCCGEEKAKAYLHACLVGRALVEESMQNTSSMLWNEDELIHRAEKVGQVNINTLWPSFATCTGKAGWKLDKTEISTNGYELWFE